MTFWEHVFNLLTNLCVDLPVIAALFAVIWKKSRHQWDGYMERLITRLVAKKGLKIDINSAEITVLKTRLTEYEVSILQYQDQIKQLKEDHSIEIGKLNRHIIDLKAELEVERQRNNAFDKKAIEVDNRQNASDERQRITELDNKI